MHRLIIISILISLTVSLTGQELNPDFKHKTSYVSKMIAFDVEFNATMSSEKSNYWSLLNTGPYAEIDTVIVQHGKTIVRLNTLSLQSGINNLRLFYKSADKTSEFSHQIMLVNPELTEMSIFQNNIPVDKNQSFYILNKNEEVLISYSAEFPLVSDPSPYSVAGSKNLKGIKYKFNTEDWNDSGIQGELKLNNFLEGANQLLITYQSEASVNYPIEKVDTINFFFLDSEMPKSVWKKDTLIELHGKPAGGWFTGDGIVGNSNYFNPILAKIGDNIITYHYPLEGNELVKSIGIIKVLPAYNFSITGEQLLCLNAQAEKYEIQNFSTEYMYVWNIIGGSMLDFNANSKCNFVNWNRDLPNGENFGKVMVTAVHKETNMNFTSELKVFLKESVAEDKPNLFFGDEAKRLVVCDNTTAVNYSWSKDGLEPKETENPFFYFNGSGVKYEVVLFTEEGCKTTQNILASTGNPEPLQYKIIGKVTEGINIVEKDMDIQIFPNPAQNLISLKITGAEYKRNLYIINSLSQTVLSDVINERVNIKEIDIQSFPQGQYFIRIEGNNKINTQHFVKIK